MEGFPGDESREAHAPLVAQAHWWVQTHYLQAKVEKP
jgi:hypothetical protein